MQADQVDDTFEPTNQPNIYKDLEGSGYFRFDVLGSSPEDQTTDPRGEPEDHADAKAEFQPIPVSEVESFVNEVISQQDRLSGAKVMRAEKRFDSFSEERFVYEVATDRGISLFFDQDKEYLHAALTDEFADQEFEFVEDDNTLIDLSASLQNELGQIDLDEAEREFSSIDNNSFVFRTFFDLNNTQYVAHLSQDFKIILISQDREGDFLDDWKPVELPQIATNYLLQKYPDIVDATGNYHTEERPTPNGQSKELVAFLDDGTEVIFDANGTFSREFNPFNDFKQNLDAGLKIDSERSSDLGGNFVHISKVEQEENEDFSSLMYRISLTNTQLQSDQVLSLQHMELSQSIPVNQEINLTFTYEMGPPRYFVVSGAEVSAFKHRMPEWDKPGSFSIKAKTISPVTSESNDLSLTSTFGITVEMGGERFYEGTIFETNVINLDVDKATFSSPWDPTVSIAVKGTNGQLTNFKAHIPRRLLSGHYGIMDPNQVKAAIVDSEGRMSFVQGSKSVEGDEVHVGSSFERKPYKGMEMNHEGPVPHFGPNSEYAIDDQEFGITDGEPMTEPVDQQTSESEQDNISGVAPSKFDFDGDGIANSYLEVSFQADIFPAEIQIGDPFIDPFANLDDSQFGSISGSVSDNQGNSLREYDVWFFKVPEAGKDLYSGDPVFFDFERTENGFTAKLPAGSYHAEAFAFDPESDTPYKPQLYMDGGSPAIFLIEGNSTSISGINFTLEPEFRVSNEFGEVEASVSLSGGGEVDHVFFDLYPVDGSGVRQTDYPVHSFGLDRSGKIKGKVPAGTFAVEVFSPDNSLSLASNDLQITIEANQLNNLETIQLVKKQMVTVRGSISDGTNPIWAEIVFVDPQDEGLRFWPIWDESAVNLQEGDYAFKVPQGSYKILAERFDGMFNSAYYDADNNGEADVVVISGDLSDINFVLESRPTATVTIRLLDGNTSAPVKYAWFDFFDAEDEYAPIMFPHLGMIDFEDNSFDGTYTLSIPGGDYKLFVGAHDYEGVFRVLDESGNASWNTGSWEDGASITLTDGQATDLGDVNMTSFGKSEAELFGFAWLDEGEELSGGSTITGTVKTSSGIAVPKARIIAHTVDYIFWFDHVQTRSDGSYELKNLPEGEWMVFAEPPFDSETFQGFRESNQTMVSLNDGDSKSVDIVLQGSNVFGRVLFPQKNRESGVTKNQGLGHAFIWAYRDEDQDGEPDWDEDIIAGNAQLNEAFGETDNNGYFSFYLEEAGKYSLRIDIPGQLSALSPRPIGFTLKNPNESVKLGNAIKIDWKSDVRATAFDIERKSSNDSSYISLFAGENNDSKPGPQAKTFVDSTVNPGLTYNYRVVAETANGQITLDATKVRVSDPIIFLAPPSKTITGYVLDSENSPISGAEVVAWREEGEGWSSTFTEEDGSYELTAGPGKWEITIYRPYDKKVDWVYDAAPKRVKFGSSAAKESKTKNFVVSRMGGGKIVGTINLPTGVTASDLSTYVYIDAFDPEGRGNWAQPESNGTFEIPLQPGQYELSLWIDPQLQGFGSPEVKFVRVGKNTVNIGELSLTSRNKTLSGVVSTGSGTTLPNVEVWAWSDKGGWVSDTTNINGEYSLAVSAGRWEVGYDLPVINDGSEPPYLLSPPKRIKINDGDSNKTLNFTVREAGAKISGIVYGPNGNPVSDLNAWVYARAFHAGEEDRFNEIVADVPLTSKGTFSFPGVPGEYLVGIWMPPGADYGFAGEKYYKVEVSEGSTVLKDQNDQVVNQASFILSQNDSVVSGAFKLNGQAVTGLTGEVHAMRVDGDGWQTTAIEDNGTYELTLAAGKWAIDYYIEADASDRKIPRNPSEPILVSAIASTTVVKDITLATASASISGTVLYDTNRSAVVESSVYVWAYREGSEFRKEYWNEVETDENGTFTISVLPGGKYEVGAILSQELRELGYLDSLIEKANLSSGSISDLNLTITKPSSENFIAGTILDPTGNPVSDAIVYAWSDDGREAYVETNANGEYSLQVPNGAVWHVGAEYAEIDENGSESYFSTEYEVDVDLKSATSSSGLNLALKAPEFEVPDGTSVTFDPTIDFVTQLPDGSELTIPGGAANVDSDVTEVRIVITPTAKGLSKSADEKPADYGYSIELFDDKGKKVEGNFKKDVILSIPVDVNASLAKGMDVNNVEAMYYSTTKDAWDKAKTSTWDKNSSTLTMTTDHFTTFAAVSTPDISDISSGLAKVDNGTKGDWYTLDWLGYFYDASAGWIYHMELGWLYAEEAENGNLLVI